MPENQPPNVETRAVSELGTMMITSARARLSAELMAIVEAVGRNDGIPINDGWQLNTEACQWVRTAPAAPPDVTA